MNKLAVCDNIFFFSSRRRHTRLTCDWSSDVSLPISAWSNHATRRVERDSAGFRDTGLRQRRDRAPASPEIGRASCRERVELPVVGESFTAYRIITYTIEDIL